MDVLINVEVFEVQLINSQVTSPAIIRLGKEHIDVDIITPDGQIGIEVGLIDSTISGPMEPYVKTLYYFGKSEGQ